MSGTFRQFEQQLSQPAVIACKGRKATLHLEYGVLNRASLYERPVNLDAAKASHAEFRRVMREAGLRVLTVREILSYGVADHIGARVELEELAMKALSYNFAEGYREEDLRDEVN